MGPAQSEGLSLPSRPQFSWDTKSPPWTDGKGNGEQYLKSVKLWKLYHDRLPVNNSNKIPAELQGIVLKSQLFGRAENLGSKISDDELTSENGALILAKAVYKVDTLSKVTKIAEQFNKLLSTTRGDSENLKGFESRFEAQLCTFNEACGQDVLPEALIALLLMNNAKIENAQRVALLASVAPHSEESLKGQELLDSILYEKVASIIRSSDIPESMKTRTVYASSSSVKQVDIEERKKKTKCGACGQVGHWWKDDICPKKRKDNNGDSAKKRSITFN